MNEKIGILALDQFVYPLERLIILDGLRKVLPPEVEVLRHQSTAFGLLDFIEEHKHLIILDGDRSNYGKETTFGEVEYWGHLTGGIPEDIVVIGMDSIQETSESILEYIKGWNSLANQEPMKSVRESLEESLEH